MCIRSRFWMLICLALLLGGSGCVYSNGTRACRIWADYNTLKTPALFIEETDHLPPHAARVDHYRWMYNADGLARQTRSGAIQTGATIPVRGADEPQESPVPAPSELPPEPTESPAVPVPPLPSGLPRPLKSLDDSPAPAPSRPKPKIETPEEIDGPTARDEDARTPLRT